MKIKIIFFCMAVFSFTTSCGFKVLDKSENNNFSVQEIHFPMQVNPHQRCGYGDSPSARVHHYTAGFRNGF